MHIKAARLILIAAGLLVAAACGGAPPADPPPAVPSGLTAQAGDQRVTLTWDANTEPDLAGYRLAWGSSSGNLTQTEAVAAPATSAVVTGLDNGATYHFALAAVDAGGNRSAYSAEVTAIPSAQASAPAVTATEPTTGAQNAPLNASIRLSFSRAMDKPATEAAFSLTPAAPCAYTWNFTGTVMTCVPQNPLSPDTAYTATLGVGARDLQGVALAAPYTFGFTTGSGSLSACTFGDSTFGTCTFAP